MSREKVKPVTTAKTSTEELRTLQLLEESHRLRATYQLEDAQAAQVIADLANQAKSVFLATMSHEVRTPVSASQQTGKGDCSRLSTRRMGYRADVAGNGLEATRRIVETPHVASPAIIAMTANATEEDREMCFDAGMSDYISKPIRVEELVAALKKVNIKRT